MPSNNFLMEKVEGIIGKVSIHLAIHRHFMGSSRYFIGTMSSTDRQSDRQTINSRRLPALDPERRVILGLLFCGGVDGGNKV